MRDWPHLVLTRVSKRHVVWWMTKFVNPNIFQTLYVGFEKSHFQRRYFEIFFCRFIVGTRVVVAIYVCDLRSVPVFLAFIWLSLVLSAGFVGSTLLSWGALSNYYGIVLSVSGHFRHGLLWSVLRSILKCCLLLRRCSQQRPWPWSTVLTWFVRFTKPHRSYP